MAELHLQAGDDHVERLAHENDPVRAIVELIWNAIDAEAPTVTVDFERDEWLAITKTSVTDTGHGINVEEVNSTFGRIGASWKRHATKTRTGKRRLHGKRGEGRLRVFALGNRVKWVSHSVDTAGQLHRVEIGGSTQHRHVFPWDAQPASGVSTGTIVTAQNESQKSLGALEVENSLPVLRSHFAPVLLNDDDLTITYDTTTLDPADEISNTTNIALPFTDESGTEHQATLRIIEWKSGSHRAIYYGQDDEHFVHEEPAKDVESQFRYSAYVTWAVEGLPTKGVEPVKRWDGRSGRVDLHLAVKAQEFDRTRHLVVELKAPDITLGRKELLQIEDYATAVLENKAFATDKVDWDFILAGTDYDSSVENRFTEETQALGQVLAPPAKSGRPCVRVYVRRWRDILDENRRRLAFMTNNLEHDPTVQEGLGHIREQYADLLPTALTGELDAEEEE